MKKENPQISVIVPVYNVEKYLPRCIESILAQTFTDFELLLVDDGSPDNCGRICDKYAKEDERIKVFHKKNGGVGSARQYGTDNAVGKYSIHADADDWMEPDMLKRMFEKIKEKGVDMLIADFFIDLPNNKIKYRKQIANGCQSQDVMRDILQGYLFGALWHKMIRHELYRKYNVRFLKGVNYCEDVLVLVQLLQNPLRIGFIHEAFYHYNHQNNDSITRNYYTQETYKMKKLYVERLETLLAEKDSEIIETVAFNIKTEAFSHGVLSEEEYYTCKPSSLSAIICKKHCRIKYKIFLLLDYFRLCSLALLVLRIHNKHNK